MSGSSTSNSISSSNLDPKSTNIPTHPGFVLLNHQPVAPLAQKLLLVILINNFEQKIWHTKLWEAPLSIRSCTVCLAIVALHPQQRQCNCNNNCIACQLLQHLATQQVSLHWFKFGSLFWVVEGYYYIYPSIFTPPTQLTHPAGGHGSQMHGSFCLICLALPQ